MPYTSLVPGGTITASWANANVRDQVVTPFVSTAARDAAITSPAVGMVEYLSTNDAAEGLTTRTSASTWRLPWNMPWGRVAGGSSNTPTASGVSNSAIDIGLSATFTAVANRRYKVSVLVGRIAGTSSSGVMQTILTNGAGVAFQYLPFQYFTAGWVWGLASTGEFTGIAAGSFTFKLMAASDVATGATFQHAGYGSSIVVEDIGPNGAPA